MNSSGLDIILTPVPYTDRKRVKDDVKNLMDRYKTLMPQSAKYVHNDGKEAAVVSMKGTMPILFQGAKYNIPVEIFLLHRYPAVPPKFYVRPTATMTIKNNHRHVDMQGLVYLPYLNEWNTVSNLVTLMDVAASIFSFEPPLFSKPATATTIPPTTGASSTTANAGMYPLGGVNSISRSGSNGNIPNHTLSPAAAAAATATTATTIARPATTTSTATSMTSALYPGIAAATTASTSSSYPMATAVVATANPPSGYRTALPTTAAVSYASPTTLSTPSSTPSNAITAALYGNTTSYTSPTTTYTPPTTSYTTPTTASTTTTYRPTPPPPTTTTTTTSTTPPPTLSMSKHALLTALNEKLHLALKSQLLYEKQRLDEEFAKQHILSTHEQELTHAQKAFFVYETEIYQHIHTVLPDKLTTLQAEIARRELLLPEATSGGMASVEEKEDRYELMVIPYDELSVQIVKLSSELNGYEDVFYYLSQALVSHHSSSSSTTGGGMSGGGMSGRDDAGISSNHNMTGGGGSMHGLLSDGGSTGNTGTGNNGTGNNGTGNTGTGNNTGNGIGNGTGNNNTGNTGNTGSGNTGNTGGSSGVAGSNSIQNILKECRLLARKEFMAKTHLMKIQAQLHHHAVLTTTNTIPPSSTMSSGMSSNMSGPGGSMSGNGNMNTGMSGMTSGNTGMTNTGMSSNVYPSMMTGGGSGGNGGMSSASAINSALYHTHPQSYTGGAVVGGAVGGGGNTNMYNQQLPPSNQYRSLS